jgi:hypothetical protein
LDDLRAESENLPNKTDRSRFIACCDEVTTALDATT